MPKLIQAFKGLLWGHCKKHMKNRFTLNELKDLLRENNFPINKHDKLLSLCNHNGTLLTKQNGQEYEFPAGSDYGGCV